MRFKKTKTEKNHDRIETKTAYTTGDMKWLYGKEKWKNLNCIGAVKIESEKDEKNRRMTSLYLQP